MPRSAAPRPVLGPFLGLMFDRPPIAVPPTGLVDGNNFRLYQGRITTYNMGWTRFITTPLDGAVTLIDVFIQNNGTSLLLFGTPTSLYNYNNGTPLYISPQYTTGTVTISGTSVTGTGTNFQTKGYDGSGVIPVKAGDFLYTPTAGYQGTTGWTKIQSVTSDTALTLVSAPGNVTSQPFTIRYAFQGGVTSLFWDSETFPHSPPGLIDLWFATNGVDYPVSWNAATTGVSFQTTLGFKSAAKLYRYKNLMIYANLVSSGGDFRPYSFANSDNGAPTTMAGGVAFQGIVTDNEFQILNMQILGDTLMVYTNYDVIAAQFIGGSVLWAFREVVRSKGLICDRMIAVYPNYHTFVAKDGQYYYNGYYVQPIGTQIWKQVISQFDTGRAHLGFCFFNEQNQDLIWALPQTIDTDPDGDMSVAYVEHYLEMPQGYFFRPFSRRDFPFCTALMKNAVAWPQVNTRTFNTITTGFQQQQYRWTDQIFTSAFPLSLVGDAEGYVYSLYTADSQNGVGYSAFVTFPPRLTANEFLRGTVARVYPYMESNPIGAYNISVSLIGYDAVSGPPKFTDIQSFDFSYRGNRFTTHYRQCRLGQVKFSTPGPNQPWILDGYDWLVRPGGAR